MKDFLSRREWDKEVTLLAESRLVVAKSLSLVHRESGRWITSIVPTR